ncbi:GNAT family N-acetyltransferase [Paraburkholderia sediminicola]|uniref:GNAT family N-acetyltransferase n=1 Tax=Paraburkholderia rhynchosiae TaxID=487049 RepID=A0ACC7N800_9BURK
MKSNSLLAGLSFSSGQRMMATPSTQAIAQFEVVTDVETFVSLQQEWDELWRAAKGTPFQLFRYCLHALREVAIPTGATLHCIIGRKDGRMVFGWPLIRNRECLWTTLRPLAPDTSEPYLLVANGEDPESLVSAAWRVLLSSCGSDVISLPMVRTDSALYRVGLGAKRLSRGERRVVRVVPLLRCKTWAEFRGGLADSVRKEQDYLQRRLVKAGKVSMFISDLADPVSATYVRTMLEWKRQWAERVGVEGDFFKEPYQNFLRKISTDPSFKRALHLFILSLDGKAIAVNLVAISERSVIGMQAAFDPAHAKYSPGSLLLEHVMKWAFENQRDFDLGPGDSKYKSNWAGGSGYTCTDLRIAVSLWGQTDLAARALQRQCEKLRLRIAAGPVGHLWKTRLGSKPTSPKPPVREDSKCPPAKDR